MRRGHYVSIAFCLCASLGLGGCQSADLPIPDSGRDRTESAACYSNLPAPELVFEGESGDRFLLGVTNWNAYPAALFEDAPELGPCDDNSSPARAWVDIYDQDNRYVYGFCDLDGPAGLNDMWCSRVHFSGEPESVYIVITDRLCGTSYRSNSVRLASDQEARSQLEILNGDFSQGNTGFETDYNYTPRDIQYNRSYTVDSAPDGVHWAAECGFGDHTTGHGEMMIVNAAEDADQVLWSQAVNLTQGGTYELSMWLATWHTQNEGEIAVYVNGSRVGNTVLAPSVCGEWQKRSVTWTANSGTARIELVVLPTSGGDFALDDIELWRLGGDDPDDDSDQVDDGADDLNGDQDAEDCYYDLPDPQLVFEGEVDGNFELGVSNWSAYPEAFFEDAPELGPCDYNSSPARAWVDIYDQDDRRVYGFCDLERPAQLDIIWCNRIHFPGEAESVYIIITDRLCGASYRSNTVSLVTEQEAPSQIEIPNGDFSQGNIGFETDYNYTPSDIRYNRSYAVGSDPLAVHYAAECSFGDHTTGHGKMMIVNAAEDADQVLWSQTVNLTQGGTYELSMWLATWHTQNEGEIAVYVNGSRVGNTVRAPSECGQWEERSVTWTASGGVAQIELVVLPTSGGDFALDDIELWRLGGDDQDDDSDLVDDSDPGDDGGDGDSGEDDVPPTDEVNEVEITRGLPQFVLTWTGAADADLHVLDPEGTHVYWHNTAGHGEYLDSGVEYDDPGGGPENVFYDPDTAPYGDYEVWVVYYEHDPKPTTTVHYTVSVRYTYEGSLQPWLSGTFTYKGQESQHKTFTYP